MNKFTFYVEGLNQEMQASAETEKAARKAIWNSLTNEQQDAVVCIDCVDEVAA